MNDLCPTCKVKTVRFGKMAWFFTFFASSGCLIWFFGIGLLLLPFTPLAFFIPTLYKCNVCKNWWKKDDLIQNQEGVAG